MSTTRYSLAIARASRRRDRPFCLRLPTILRRLRPHDPISRWAAQIEQPRGKFVGCSSSSWYEELYQPS